LPITVPAGYFGDVDNDDQNDGKVLESRAAECAVTRVLDLSDRQDQNEDETRSPTENEALTALLADLTERQPVKPDDGDNE
jgi:hypothetical protein